MSCRETPPITDVSGGSHDPVVRRAARLAADYAAALGLAETYDAAGGKMRRWGATGAKTMANGDLLESSVLSPRSFARSEAAVLVATTGPDGIFLESVGWETDAILIRVTVAAFEEKDQIARQTMEALDYALGRIIGSALGGLARAAVPAAVVAGASAVVPWGLLPDGVKADLAKEGVDEVEGLMAWLDQHPEAERHLLNGGGGLLDGLSDSAWPGPGGLPFLPPFHATTEDAARSMGGLFGDQTSPTVTEFDSAVASVSSGPTNLQGLMENLAAINGTPSSPQPDGAIMIQQITAADGVAHYVVYAPGTDDLLPWHHDETVRDMSTNFNLIAGGRTTYGDGILQAMHHAGVGPHDPVMIVGHSQGGMQAINLLSNDGSFNITNVVTAGSPTSQEDIPRTHVLSFENSGDVVPLLNGEPNEATTNHVTVQFDDSATPGFEHDMEHYVNGARAADISENVDIDSQIASMTGFLSGTSTANHTYAITR